MAIKRTTARKDKLQIFSHNTQLDTSSNVNCYEDVLIDGVVAGARYYLTFSCGDSGKYEFNLFQIIGGVVNIIQNYEHGPSIVLKYRHRTPYYVTINGDLNDKLGMGVDYEQFDMLFKFQTQAQLQALCLEIDGTL